MVVFTPAATVRGRVQPPGDFVDSLISVITASLATLNGCVKGFPFWKAAVATFFIKSGC